MKIKFIITLFIFIHFTFGNAYADPVIFKGSFSFDAGLMNPASPVYSFNNTLNEARAQWGEPLPGSQLVYNPNLNLNTDTLNINDGIELGFLTFTNAEINSGTELNNFLMTIAPVSPSDTAIAISTLNPQSQFRVAIMNTLNIPDNPLDSRDKIRLFSFPDGNESSNIFFVPENTTSLPLILTAERNPMTENLVPKSLAAIPEPTSLLLFGSGIFGLFSWRRWTLRNRRITSFNIKE